ncbi:hypothetical protein [Streptomyces nigra]|uniref:hypothetical protein n=1 Tax=Streptomyces nigra TaxID=1827580 RepID=UPI0038294725
MTKKGSNARKARIRAQADKAGTTYRQAAQTLSNERVAWMETARAIFHSPEELRDTQEIYLIDLSEKGARLPELVKVCLYALTLRLGTGTLIDPRGVTCTVTELAAATGLSTAAVENALYVAEAHGWIREAGNKEYRLTVPGEDIDMYEYWLQKQKEPVQDVAVYQRMRDQLAAATP